MEPFFVDEFKDNKSGLEKRLESLNQIQLNEALQDFVDVFRKRSTYQIVALFFMFFWYAGKLTLSYFDGTSNIYLLSILFLIIPFYKIIEEKKILPGIEEISTLEDFLSRKIYLLKFEFDHSSTILYWSIMPLLTPLIAWYVYILTLSNSGKTPFFHSVIEIVIALGVSLFIYIPNKKTLTKINSEINFLENL